MESEKHLTVRQRQAITVMQQGQLLFVKDSLTGDNPIYGVGEIPISATTFHGLIKSELVEELPRTNTGCITPYAITFYKLKAKWQTKSI